MTAHANVVRRVASAIEWALLVFIVFLNGTVWSRLEPIFSYLWLIKGVALICAIAVTALRIWRRERISWRPLLLWLAFRSISLFIQCAFVNADLSDAVTVFGSLIIFTLYACSLSSKKEFSVLLVKFVRLVVALAAISLVFYFAGSVFHIISPTGTVHYEWDWMRTVPTYWGLYFEPQSIDILGISGIRNCGVFAEAPMFVFLLCVALFLQEIYLERSIAARLLLLVTIGTTFSTTAYIVVLVLFGLKRLLLVKWTPRLTKYAPAVGVGLVVLIVLAVAFLLKDKATTGSYGVRIDHLFACMEAFCVYFPFGCGLGNKDLVVQFMSYKQGLSVGIPYLFAQTGVLGLGLLLFPIVYGIRLSPHKERNKATVAAVVYLALYFATNVTFLSLVQWLLLPLLFFAYPRLGLDGDTMPDLAQSKGGAQ